MKGTSLMDILEKLYSMQDENYALFQAKLTPNIPPEKFIGVRVPECRRLAKTLSKESDISAFLDNLPHSYYDENILHALLISEIKDYYKCIYELERFLPYVDNWAVCDIISPKPFKKHKDTLIVKIKEWSASNHTYTCRFGLRMLMSHFLDEDFKPEYLEIPASVNSDEYYINMMKAWFFATALAKQWETTLPYVQERKLDEWTHKKTIQKAIESYRITKEQKDFLKTLR